MNGVRSFVAGACLAIGAPACVHTPADPAATVNDVADRYYRLTLLNSPEVAYFSGVTIDRHDGMFDNGPDAQRRTEAEHDEMLATLRSFDATALTGRTEWITYALLRQQLAANEAIRICRTEWWNVNHMGGWQLGYPRLAELQPVGTAELRRQALARWSKFPGYVQQEIENLRSGLAQRYSSPQPVVRRVIEQIDGLLELPLEQSPFFSMAIRDTDPDFVIETTALVSDEIIPALSRYREFLANDYLPRARAELSVTANPDGRACYEASLRAYTTIDRSGAEVFALGQETVAANRASVLELGEAAYGLTEFEAIIAAAKNDPDERFETAGQLLSFSRDAVERAEEMMPRWVGRMPAQPVEVVPFPEHEEGTGRSAHYRPGNDERPAEYRIPLHDPAAQLPGNAEATAFHETWPGHHLQVATAQAIEGMHPVTRIIWFSGPGEGWARYSEALADEMGLYQTRTGPILRRAWPARGMVVDPGIHLFGWSRERAAAFMAEAGRFSTQRSEEMVDRIAILPGQLTAYDSGGLEIFALRAEAEAALGDRFDIREFHDVVLENGTIPMPDLRTHVENWIAKSLGAPR